MISPTRLCYTHKNTLHMLSGSKQHSWPQAAPLCLLTFTHQKLITSDSQGTLSFYSVSPSL
jgi:hypothetical protein